MLNTIPTHSTLEGFDRSRRRCAANVFLGELLQASARFDELLAVLAATPAESADDRLDDLCAVHVRGVLSDADVDRLIDCRTPEYRREVSAVYGESYTALRVWKHSWTRRSVRVNGERVVCSRTTWLKENATAILRAGGALVKPYGGNWVRIAEDIPYADLLDRHLTTLPNG